jgi:hypothetical protein
MDKLALTINEFCSTHSLSRSQFYALVRRGDGPKLMRVASRQYVSVEAARAWRRRMEQADQAEEVGSVRINGGKKSCREGRCEGHVKDGEICKSMGGKGM